MKTHIGILSVLGGLMVGLISFAFLTGQREFMNAAAAVGIVWGIAALAFGYRYDC